MLTTFLEGIRFKGCANFDCSLVEEGSEWPGFGIVEKCTDSDGHSETNEQTNDVYYPETHEHYRSGVGHPEALVVLVAALVFYALF